MDFPFFAGLDVDFKEAIDKLLGKTDENKLNALAAFVSRAEVNQRNLYNVILGLKAKLSGAGKLPDFDALQQLAYDGLLFLNGTKSQIDQVYEEIQAPAPEPEQHKQDETFVLH